MNKKHIIILILLILAAGALFWVVQNGGMVLPPKVHKVGIVSFGGAHNEVIIGLKSGLRALGYEDGVNIIYDVVDAAGSDEKAREAAQKFLADGVDAVYSASTPVTKQVAEVIKEKPVVFNIVSDPVGSGLVKSMISSGNNLTGCSNFVAQTGPKRLEILKTILPQAKKVVVLYDPDNPFSKAAIVTLRQGADLVGVELEEKHVRSKEDVINTMLKIVPGEFDAFFHLGEAKVSAAADRVIAIANQSKLPTIAHEESLAQKGMLAVYGPSWQTLGQQCASTMDKVLKGTKPSDIPVQIPGKMEFTLNLKTARMLGVEVPENVLANVDKFVE